MKSGIAAVLSVMLLIGLPLAGAVGGAWSAFTLATPEPEPEPAIEEGEQRCGMWWITRLIDSISTGIVMGLVVVGGGVAGLTAGVVIALPAVNGLSEWSARDVLTGDEADE